MTDVVRRHLEKNPHFHCRLPHLTIEQCGDIIILSGPMPSFYSKQVLQEAVRNIPGVTRFENWTVVAPSQVANTWTLKLESGMNEDINAATDTDILVAQLADKNSVVREKSREQLIQLATPEVTRALLQAVIDPRTHVRWEAAKALQAIADPVAASTLMHAMEDEDADVRWVAAEGLIALNEVGVRTALSGLIVRAGSIEFRKSAHHVLHESTAFADAVAPVMQALGHSEPAVAVPQAAHKALVALNETRHAP